MEVPIIQTWAHMHPPNVVLKPAINTSSLAPELAAKRRNRIMTGRQDMDARIAVNYSVITHKLNYELVLVVKYLKVN